MCECVFVSVCVSTNSRSVCVLSEWKMVVFKTVCSGVSVKKYIFAKVYDAADDHCLAQIFYVFWLVFFLLLVFYGSIVVRRRTYITQD